MHPRCQHNDCLRDAAGMLGIEFFPPVAVLRHYRTDQPLTRLTVGLELCVEHVAEIKPVEFLGENILRPLVEVLEKHSGTVVDLAATRPVLIAYGSAEYLALRKAQASKPKSPAVLPESP